MSHDLAVLPRKSDPSRPFSATFFVRKSRLSAFSSNMLPSIESGYYQILGT